LQPKINLLFIIYYSKLFIMLLERSIVTIADNSGAKKVMLFSVSGKNGRYSVGVGDIVKGSVKSASVGGKVKKTQKVNVLIVRTKMRVRRKDNSYFASEDNAGIIVSKQGEPVGTRVFGPIAREIREKGYKSVVSLAEEVL
jgi:large subunit ribosomal protein L14